jgi:hypothetical protein
MGDVVGAKTDTQNKRKQKMCNKQNIVPKEVFKNTDPFLSYMNKRESVFKWLSLNKCLIIKADDQDIMFVAKGVLYMIHLKKNSTNVSSRLQHKIDTYISYGVVAKAIYNVFELETILHKTETI